MMVVARSDPLIVLFDILFPFSNAAPRPQTSRRIDQR
jgi:hypothetical protein